MHFFLQFRSQKVLNCQRNSKCQQGGYEPADDADTDEQRDPSPPAAAGSERSELGVQPGHYSGRTGTAAADCSAPQNTVSETEFRHLQEQNELLREANEQLQSRQTRKRALIETILLCEDKDDEAMEEAVETFLKGPRQKAEGDQLDSGKPSDDGCGLPSANPDEPGDGPPEVIPVPDGHPQLDLRTCRSCGQLSYTRKNMCVNTQCETWPAFRFSVLFVSCCVFP